MRIVGDIEHPVFKITIFKNDGKYSVKFETALLEQTYKFREDERIQSVEDVKKIVDDIFIQKIEILLRGMNDAKFEALVRNLPLPDEDEFDKIV
jgi:hypothetical protein